VIACALPDIIEGSKSVNYLAHSNPLKDTTLYVVRISTGGNLRNSAPCKNCLSVIKFVGIKKIVFSSDDGNIKIYKTDNYKTKYITSCQKYMVKTISIKQ